MIAPLPGPLDARSKLRRALGIGGAAFCVFVAIGVAALFLTLMSARKAGSAEQPSRVSLRAISPRVPYRSKLNECGVDPSFAPHLLVARKQDAASTC
jgi:hypothetical protein